MNYLTLEPPIDVFIGKRGDVPRRWEMTGRGNRVTPDGDYTYLWGGTTLDMPDLLPDAALCIDRAEVREGYLTLAGEVHGLDHQD